MLCYIHGGSVMTVEAPNAICDASVRINEMGVHSQLYTSEVVSYAKLVGNSFLN